MSDEFKPQLFYIRFENGETIIAYVLASFDDRLLVDKPIYIYTNDSGGKKYEYVVSSWLPIGNVDTSQVELKEDQIMYKLPLSKKKLGEMEDYMRRLYSETSAEVDIAQSAIDEVAELLKKLQKGSKDAT